MSVWCANWRIPTFHSDMSKIYTIYKASCVASGDMYIGYTKRPLWKRVRDHRLHARSGSNKRLHVAIRDYGFESFQFSEVVQCKSREDALRLEADLIREASVLHPNTLLNLCHSIAYRRVYSAERLERLRISNVGRKASKETRKKMSIGRTGDKHCCYDNTLYTFTHKIYGDVVCTQYNLRKMYGLKPMDTSYLCRRKIKTSKGWSIRWGEHA